VPDRPANLVARRFPTKLFGQVRSYASLVESTATPGKFVGEEAFEVSHKTHPGAFIVAFLDHHVMRAIVDHIPSLDSGVRPNLRLGEQLGRIPKRQFTNTNPVS
jgi:hypothetical protein